MSTNRMSPEARLVYVERRQQDKETTIRHRTAVKAAWLAKGVVA